ncbi:MAG TPA: M20/M25/M40 family metallo-hydrolase [Bacteroidota bacterium]|jgi:hypothetical protein|nr:M20/M25/M40 family metallo-hydrolase [Bacteroidota bacterium]
MMKYITLLVFTLSSFAGAQEALRSARITPQELQRHIKYLSSEELKGRRTGEEGNQMAAEYIAREFEQYGLKPAGDNGKYFQSFPFLASVREGDDMKLSCVVGNKTFECKPDDDFNLQSVSKDTSLRASLVFAGYGISADSLQYDDYAGVDVKDKVVVLLRYTPEGSRNESRFMKYAALLVKIANARDHGAAGVILVTGPLDTDKPKLIPFQQLEGADADVAVMSMRWDILDTLMHSNDVDLRTLQQTINDSKIPHSFDLEQTNVELRTHVVKEYGTSSNILGVLPGSDPKLTNEVIVIGAHMDHLGMGGKGSLAPDTVAIHHGADDNASGTAGLLEAAQNLAAAQDRAKRSILFIAFSGEELGLLGSDYYVKHPTLPLDHTVAMLNMDMIGRLKDSVLVVEGMATSPRWEEFVKKENRDSLDLRLKGDGVGPSDHSSFYLKDIPVMFFFTNLHSDYHRPSDTWDKINYSGEQKVVELVSRIATDIAALETRPAFTRAAASGMSATGGDRQGVRVSLGVIPDYAEDVPGLKISGTRPGSAAEKAGLKGGDIIVKFGEKTVKNIYDFTFLLGEYKPGDEVIIVVKRGNDEVSAKAILEARK